MIYGFKLLIFALISFIWVQGSSQDKTKYRNGEKYAFVSFTADEKAMSPKKEDNFKIAGGSTEFQVKTKDGAIYSREPLNASSQIALALDLIRNWSFRVFIHEILYRLRNFSHKKHFFAIVISLVFILKGWGKWWLETILPDHFPIQKSF
jgi:hypothetical protein